MLPVSELDVPGAQMMHAEVPVAFAYVPVRHAVHVSASLVLEKVPTGQTVQLPIVPLRNVPGVHGV